MASHAFGTRIDPELECSGPTTIQSGCQRKATSRGILGPSLESIVGTGFLLESLAPAFFTNQHGTHGVVTFEAAILLVRRLRGGSKAFIAAWSMAARLFWRFFFGIALARWFDGVLSGFVVFVHVVLAILAPLPVALALLISAFHAHVGPPILLIGHPSPPSSGRLDAGVRTVPIQVMLRPKSRLATFEQARSRRKSSSTSVRRSLFGTMLWWDPRERNGLSQRNSQCPGDNSTVRRF